MRKLSVQWFPGHMTKARRMMEQEIRLIDVVVEMLDARAVRSSENPLLNEILKDKPRVIALNKSDLADLKVTKNWIEYYKNININVIEIDAAKGKGIKKLISALKREASSITAKWTSKGVKNRNIRVMIVGVPNVGKSSLINRLAGGAKTRIANTPGVTRGKQWINLSKGLDLLDTPGVLWPKFEDHNVAFALAITGAVKEEVFNIEEAVLILLDFLILNYPDNIKERYKIDGDLPLEAEKVRDLIANKRGCIAKGGVADTMKVSNLILKEFKSGLLGRISIDNP